MSRNPQPLTKSEQVAVNLMTVPFTALFSAAHLVVNGIAKARSKTKQAPKAPAQPSISPKALPVSPPSTFTIADRVCSANIGGQQVNFFQYHRAGLIRISCRANRRVLHAAFTADVAEQCGIAFDLDGAIQWIRERGFPRQDNQSATAGKQRHDDAVLGAEDEESPPFDQPYKSPRMARPGLEKAAKKSAPQGASDQASHTLSPVENGKGRPFTGRILFFGEEKRNGRPGEKPFVTYVMKLESESSEHVKDFLGEHLAELVEQHNLRVGQVVTVQLMGREHFFVEVNGKLEERRRNHYSIKTHTH